MTTIMYNYFALDCLIFLSYPARCMNSLKCINCIVNMVKNKTSDSDKKCFVIRVIQRQSPDLDV